MSEIQLDFGKASVLIVDASQLCVEVLAAILNGIGFRKIHRAGRFKVASDLVKLHSIDLIFMDPYPYGEDGYDFVRWLRSERLGTSSTAPVLITSANAGVRTISRARECGADYVVAKPFSTRTIIDRIMWVVESEGRRGELVAPQGLVSSTGSGVDLW